MISTMNLIEPLAELNTRSRVIVLDFSKIPKDTSQDESIEVYFKDLTQKGENPRLPQNRQAFNDHILRKTKSRYLVGQYGEDRVVMLADTAAGREGRTIHMALDIFAINQEEVVSPCEGMIVRSDYEQGFGEYGNYIIIQPKGADYFIFLGHFSGERRGIGVVQQGEVVGRLGDYRNNENGGWSRHLHLQILRELPPEGKTPDGYSTKDQYEFNANRYPNPLNYFTDLKLQ